MLRVDIGLYTGRCKTQTDTLVQMAGLLRSSRCRPLSVEDFYRRDHGSWLPTTDLGAHSHHVQCDLGESLVFAHRPLTLSQFTEFIA